MKQFDVSKVDTKAKNYEVTVANYDAIGETNAKNFASIVKDDTSAWACGNGAVTEIYATSKGNEFKAVVTNEYLGYIDAAPVKANEKTGADRYVKIKVNGAVKNFETEEFAKKDYVLVTMKAGKIDTVKKVEGIKDVAVDKFIANESVTFGGETYKFSQNLASGTGFTNKADFENKDTFEFDPATYTFFLDSQGNVIGIEEYDAGDITDYAYIVKVQAQANEGATLLGSAEEDIVVAKVIFTDGTEKTVELKVTEENKVAKVMYPAADGSVTKAAVKDIADTENETPIENWFSYVKNDDGTYSFCEKEGNVDVADADVDLVKGEVGKINTDYLTTSKTTVTTISAAGALTKVTGLVKAELDLTVVENEGEEDEETYSNLILFTYDSNDFVTGIYAVMQANPVAATATDYVYALEQGAQLKNGVEWTFVENGQKVTYVIDENTPYIVEKGHVYTLTTEDGKIMANDVAADIRVVANIEVDLVDEAFVLVGTTPYYVTDKTAVYLVEDGEVGVDALVKDDVCTFVYALEDAEDEDSAKTLIAAYITKAK